MKALKVIALLLLSIAIIVGGLILYAPRLDGPILHLAGGPFKQASVDFAELDLKSLPETPYIQIEVQDIARPSITVGVLTLKDAVFVPATLTPSEKRWPAALEQDPRIRIRHNDKVVEAYAYRVREPDLHRKLSVLGAQKYRASYFVAENTWYFRVLAERRPKRDLHS